MLPHIHAERLSPSCRTAAKHAYADPQAVEPDCDAVKAVADMAHMAHTMVKAVADTAHMAHTS